MPAYSGKAQPYLDSIADGVFTSRAVREWLLYGTQHAEKYSLASPMVEEQKAIRWAIKPTIQPFWANYWCGKDANCSCRIDGSKGLESDAIFFLRNSKGRRLAIHVEFKHPFENFGFGQPESYPLRAECFSRTHSERKTLNAHEDWTTVVFCGDEAVDDARLSYFDRVILHSDAAAQLPEWPVQ